MIEEGKRALPNGCTLFWRRNEAGGRTYTSDEIGGGVTVWDTALVAESSLLAAMVIEATIEFEEYHEAKKEKRA